MEETDQYRVSREDCCNSILLINKPKGVTSYSVVETIKKLLGIQKVGHSGTLDKAASGLLVICTGRATKLARYFLDSNKLYRGVVKMGIATDTCDSEGSVVIEKQCPNLDDELLQRIISNFTGIIDQIPPEYSALKVKGLRASDRMRRGEKVVLEPRCVEIMELLVTRKKDDETALVINVACSKGTYIRSLARDIGEFVGCGAHLTELHRIGSGSFSVNSAVSPEELEKVLKGGKTGKKFLLSPLEALSHFNKVVIKDSVAKKVYNGAIFARDDIIEMDSGRNLPYLILDNRGTLIAIASINIDIWKVRYHNVFNN